MAKRNYVSSVISEIIRKKEKPNFQRPLLDMAISITTRCNFNCPYCLRIPVDKNKTVIKDLPISTFETILKEGKKINFKTISLTGGEPILHSEFEKIIAVAVKENYRFSIISNGWLYKEYWPIIDAHRSHFRWLILSLDGVTAEVHDAVRNKPGSFKKVVEAIAFYKEKKVLVTINFCVTKKNWHQIEELPSFCLKNGVGIARISTIIPPYKKGEVNFPGDTLADDERNMMLGKILELPKKYGNQFFIWPNPSFAALSKNHEIAGFEKHLIFCPALIDRAIHIDHDGGMLFCCNIYKECPKKPLIQEIGFEKSYRITKIVAAAIKEKFLSIYTQGNFQENYRICEFCNENIDFYLERAIKEIDSK